MLRHQTLQFFFKWHTTNDRSTRWRSWLRHCATNWKVAGSIPRGFTEIFHWHNPSGRNMALGLTEPLTEMSIRNISWRIKPAGAYGRQPYHLHVPIVLKSGSLTLLETSGPAQTCNGIALPFTTNDRLPTLHSCEFMRRWRQRQQRRRLQQQQQQQENCIRVTAERTKYRMLFNRWVEHRK